ncbi:MAG: ECF transporter S component [Oscillospiraceae bacterium]
MRKLTDKFSLYHLVVIAFMSACGIAIKSIIVPLVHIVTSSLFIPGGAIAGGIYMLFLVLARGICKKFGTGFLTGLTQAVMVMIVGVSGSHGIISLVTYAMPGLAVDIVFLFAKKDNYGILTFMVAGMAANLTGSLLVNSVFFNLPLVPLMLSISLGALSGGFGGVIAWQIYKNLKKSQLL